MQRLLLILLVLALPVMAFAQDVEEPRPIPICDLLAGMSVRESAACIPDEGLVCSALPDASTQERVSYYMGEGAGLYLSGQTERALLSYSCVVEEIDTSNIGARIRRAIAHTTRRDYANAIEDYTEAMAIDDSLPSLYNNRGIVYAAMQDYEAATGDFTEAITRDPNYVIAYSNRGVIQAVLGEYDAALTDLETAIDISGIDDVLAEMRSPGYNPNDPPEYDRDHAQIYALHGIIRSSQALQDYNNYILLMRGNADQRIQGAAGSLESRVTFELRLDDGTWLLTADFSQLGVPEP